jgi:hypothetical protein
MIEWINQYETGQIVAFAAIMSLFVSIIAIGIGLYTLKNLSRSIHLSAAANRPYVGISKYAPSQIVEVGFYIIDVKVKNFGNLPCTMTEWIFTLRSEKDGDILHEESTKKSTVLFPHKSVIFYPKLPLNVITGREATIAYCQIAYEDAKKNDYTYEDMAYFEIAKNFFRIEQQFFS